ncbi:Electron transfer flavoprotein, beta subunit [Moorella glycerini]|uniref:Electron transfer flavoprotein small subunit n=1 Tax=Neomoorella stamsii TaxID=1266720 RepID=A0A9X7J125_9FIRM|nr:MULTISPECIES: electron transfer flavoprotein subunit beta/FixA family protein [Moorella]PRR71286.1 Acryloyl-CoA reductase electron transfer subunit gamma [Moorella stamsii]CEP66673.1 Electron transfer flavoprotein, beta subunit [Moorella glycerini]
MRIIVCIKQVPDTTEVRIDPRTGTLIRTGVPSIINPEDLHALEAALAIKDQQGAEVIALSMGPPQAQDALLEALAMGVDRAILLSDRNFAGADTAATSYTLARAIKKIGSFDLVLTGRQAIDGDTAQVGPQLAELLDIPQVTYVQQLSLAPDGTCRLQRALENGYEVVETRLPALFTVVKELNTPRYPSIRGIVRACRQGVTAWTSADIAAVTALTGLNGSPTRVRRTFIPEHKKSCTILNGSPQESCRTLLQHLKERRILKFEQL